jgi:3-oxoacyl-[acyl-carrier protein] reductase
LRLKDKIAIVTGGGQGFGEGIVERFAAEGCRVVVNDLNAQSAERVATAVNAKGGKAASIQGDVSKDADWEKILKFALDTFGGLSIVVNNAGTTHRNQSLITVGESDFDRVFAVNVKSLYHSARHCVPYFRRNGGGVFVNIASTAGVRPRPGLVWYNGSKGAAIVCSRAMAVELAPDRIRVNVVNPVAGDTPLLGMFMGSDTPEMRAKFISTIPLGRLSQPLDIANACLYLASDEAEFITGACLEVDGGRCV